MTKEEKSRIKRAYHGQLTDDIDAYNILLYHLFAEKYGWTPMQVDAIPLKTILLLVELIREEGETNAMSNRLMSGMMK